MRAGLFLRRRVLPSHAPRPGMWLRMPGLLWAGAGLCCVTWTRGDASAAATSQLVSGGMCVCMLHVARARARALSTPPTQVLHRGTRHELRRLATRTLKSIDQRPSALLEAAHVVVYVCICDLSGNVPRHVRAVVLCSKHNGKSPTRHSCALSGGIRPLRRSALHLCHSLLLAYRQIRILVPSWWLVNRTIARVYAVDCSRR